MTIRLYDTAARAVRDFVPVRPGEVGIYLCGATVQAPPHIGHIRSGVSFDILRRWLTHRGLDVTFVRNVTDIDDKILTRAAADGEPWWALAQRNERAFAWAYDVLGCLPPTVEPRATGHVPEMVRLMQRLIDSGHAYAADGDVYFDVGSLPDYGALSGQKPENMLVTEPPTNVGPAGTSTGTGSGAAARKRNPLDFALWKGAKPGEPAWDTPWGTGRPGWHLECSAMAHKYLGAEFDIHGGGLDLVFPHHENEVAQSTAAGDPFARYWLHNAWVTTAGEKMSKSLGNSLLVSEMVKRVRPVELRYYLGAAHYRSHIEYSEAALDEAAAGYRRLENFVLRATEVLGAGAPSEGRPAFAAALDDDLGVPQALAVLHDTVREGNSALAAGDHDVAGRALTDVRAMLDVLGLDPLSEPWASTTSGRGGGAGSAHAVIDALVQVALEQRAAARARKDFAAADQIRDQLTAAGVVVEDTSSGPRWTLSKA